MTHNHSARQSVARTQPASIRERALSLRARNIPKTVAAELLGIGRWSFDRIISDLGIDWPRHVGARRVEIDGITATFAEHGARLGINPDTLASRFKRTGANKVTIQRMTTEHVAQFVEMRRQGLSAVVAAERLGFRYEGLHARAKQEFPEYIAIAREAKRVRRCWRVVRAQEAAL